MSLYLSQGRRWRARTSLFLSVSGFMKSWKFSKKIFQVLFTLFSFSRVGNMITTYGRDEARHVNLSSFDYSHNYHLAKPFFIFLFFAAMWHNRFKGIRISRMFLFRQQPIFLWFSAEIPASSINGHKACLRRRFSVFTRQSHFAKNDTIFTTTTNSHPCRKQLAHSLTLTVSIPHCTDLVFFLLLKLTEILSDSYGTSLIVSNSLKI